MRVAEGGGDGGGSRFEASILRKPRLNDTRARRWTGGERLQDVLVGTWATPEEAREELVEEGWDFVESADGRVAWVVWRNGAAAGEFEDCKVEWKWGVDTSENDRGRAGNGVGFMDALEASCIVVLWARAEGRQSEDKVGAASIEIEYELPPPNWYELPFWPSY
ncbi:uncharacterized protein BKCO1_1320001 [Diplodia corticola]|uniref:Uncharacterized protein n=1 Tax=Diplodia corticola TaxID=236234 RepID=A0A1J9QIF3_9PEZI|nr:uncharacterized protein BKCO1_1320001 [Diplodia corticola]OJD28630.1 hypothetical protein BKCO1_1320001 [Diplodia corticola]